MSEMNEKNAITEKEVEMLIKGELITTREVAKILRIKPESVWNLVERGKIKPVLKAGKKLTYFRKSDVLKLFKKV